MQATKQWLTAERDDGVHVVPLDDSVLHAFSDDCDCGPTLEYVDGDASARLYIHHSLDGREFTARIDRDARP